MSEIKGFYHQSKVWCSFDETLNFLSELLAEPGIHQPAYFQRKLYPNGDMDKGSTVVSTVIGAMSVVWRAR